MNDLFSNVIGWTKSIVELGFSLALVFLVVDVLLGELPESSITWRL